MKSRKCTNKQEFFKLDKGKISQITCDTELFASNISLENEIRSSMVIESAKKDVREMMRNEGYIPMEETWKVRSLYYLEPNLFRVICWGRECKRELFHDKSKCRTCHRRFICLTKGDN